MGALMGAPMGAPRVRRVAFWAGPLMSGQDERVSQLAHVDDPDRLRALVDAVLLVGSDLSLPVVLHRFIDAAVSLVDARYGAVGVLDEANGGLAEFIHVGLEPRQAEAIGHLPEGRGILGTLILEPQPLRLQNPIQTRI